MNCRVFRSRQYVQPFGHSSTMISPWLRSSLSQTSPKFANILLCSATWLRTFWYTPGFLTLMYCQGDPPVHGLADMAKVGSLLLGWHTGLVPLIAFCVKTNPAGELASSAMVTRTLSQPADSGVSCPITLSDPQHHSMHLLVASFLDPPGTAGTAFEAALVTGCPPRG